MILAATRSSTPALRLTGRRGSHFTRVARMMAHELGVPLELEIAPDLLRLDAAGYGDHPALRIPVLHVGEAALFGTENICRRLVELAGRVGDPAIVLAEHATTDVVRCAQELVWHAMAAQVQLRVGLQLAGLPAESVFFAKARAGLDGALAWLDAHLADARTALPAARQVSLLEVTLFCLLEHLALRPTVSLDARPHLRAFVAAYAARPAAAATPYEVDPPAPLGPAPRPPAAPPLVHRGELYWIAPDDARGPAPPYAHPHVIVQDDVFNHARVATLVVCALTSNLGRASEPGNVLLDPGEGDLPRQSVVVVSQVEAVPRARLGARIGALAPARVDQILDGLRFQQRAFFGGR